MLPGAAEGIHLVRNASFYSDLNGQYYWVLLARNGRELCRSSEMYKGKQGAIKSIYAVARFFDNNQHYYDHTSRFAKKANKADLIVYEVSK